MGREGHEAGMKESRLRFAPTCEWRMGFYGFPLAFSVCSIRIPRCGKTDKTGKTDEPVRPLNLYF